ncbi:MAG: bifunctional glutamate N-acetyltransferase/amino-acid acetyltransferase ArgJ [Deltaproteobacteria bacterium]|nr:bifunctional glutamate N-acetyltransferase/amino-acid acetyltransferase ArgJ [Deltaproteobacteria bacterium]
MTAMETTMHDSVQVPGFLGNGIAAGIKGGRGKDLSLIFSKVPARAVGVFTTNRFKAAPVILDMKRIKKGIAQAIIVNSGNANAATGKGGDEDASTMSRVTSRALGIEDELVLVASTGIIGEKLPIEKIARSIEPLVGGLSADGMPSVAEGIITTDRFPKVEYRKCFVGGKEVTICGIAKGAGMIEPNMATMLSFIMTDADIDYACLTSLFKESAGKSFNAITVDGCMSTNDTAIMLANGVAGNSLISETSGNLVEFREALSGVMVSLAKSIVKDGEGATKLIEIVVEGAKLAADAKAIAYAIANSNLVKTAFFGEDPNWGRIISAAGSTGVPFSTDSLELYIEDVPLFINGVGISGKQAAGIMKKDNIRVLVRLGMGKETFSVYTSDLSHEYIDINALYHS